MYSYSHRKINELFTSMLQSNLSKDALAWLNEELRQMERHNDPRRFGIAFVATPRKTGKQPVQILPAEAAALEEVRPGLSITGWTTDQLARVLLILNLDTTDADRYVTNIETLFLNAEMNELVALYSALPLLAYPERWKKRCAEGIRSNIGQVLESVMCRNPYPSENLDEPAWNQLVLKAIFTDKPLLQIHHLQERANQKLAQAISEFAHERWAAHRTVNPLVWICVEPFVDASIFPDLERLAMSLESRERKAAALICRSTLYPPAKELLNNAPGLKELAEESLSWDVLAGNEE